MSEILTPDDSPSFEAEEISSVPNEKTAMLVGIYSGQEQKRLCNEHLGELEKLAETLGIETLQKFPCSIRKLDAATYLGKGKLEELVSAAYTLQPGIVIFDDEISPSQQRNLEKLFGRPVVDRTEVILEVFSEHAQTREAKLQIQLAKIKYEYPRLKRLWTHLSRQRGGSSQSKGEGEKQIELDRRMLKERVEKLTQELKEVKENRRTQRSARERSDIPTFAIIGYTNVGKSTLLNSLTQADVLVEDKLFATLDTTTRKFVLPNGQDILLIDTVGFIRKIPHTLVAAFRSTLEEATYAEILIHLVDVSHPMALEQAETTFEVLKELGAGQKPIITVLNKIDLCTDQNMITQMRTKYPRTVQISALQQTGFADLYELMIQEIAKRRRLVSLQIPQSSYELVSEVIRSGNILNQEYDENDVILRAEIPALLAKKLEKYIVE